ncbi:hypothetical protein DWU98_17515 [Dyella monticola]|uniref:DUF5615 domain-containing protein n=1 Tax=Dyella monticola TaxID=1927958 RepID=A0A370WTV7_9GAMM|nr:DUF5615 family PIN-like protein [Dyella monticola]RDS79588.1 hypothetical protein DWU98_17515 [Dyella monticola]
MWKDLLEIVRKDPCPPKQALEVIEYLKRGAKARFYADENFPSAATELLRSKGASVRTAVEANMLGLPDEAHAAYALKHRTILLSCDRDYLNNGRFPLISCPAIFVFQFDSGTGEEMRLAFRCLDPVFSTPQFFDKWCKVDASVHEWTKSYRSLDGATSRERHRIHEGKHQLWIEEYSVDGTRN